MWRSLFLRENEEKGGIAFKNYFVWLLRSRNIIPKLQQRPNNSKLLSFQFSRVPSHLLFSTLANYILFNLPLEEKGATEDEMVEWYHWLNGYESEQTQGHSEGQRSLVSCSPWDYKKSDTTEQLNNRWARVI